MKFSSIQAFFVLVFAVIVSALPVPSSLSSSALADRSVEPRQAQIVEAAFEFITGIIDTIQSEVAIDDQVRLAPPP
jgi:hypothetical protein